MPNPFGKSRPVDKPYAIYRAGPSPIMVWHILKTYQMPERERENRFARWFVAAKSPMTWGAFEMGDTYAREVTGYGRLVAADAAWREAYGRGDVPSVADYLATREA